jgi:hypothetical protein
MEELESDQQEEASEFEELEEDEEAEYLEDEQEVPEDEENASEDEFSEMVDEQDISQAFLAGWKAKKQVAEGKKARGFSNPAGKGKGKSSKGRGKGQPVKNLEDRKKITRCADCQQVGHWRGDEACPKVKEGKVPLRTAGTSGKPSPPRNKGIHWVEVLEHVAVEKNPAVIQA